MGLSFADVEIAPGRHRRAMQHGYFGFGGSSDKPVCATNGTSASVSSD
jgi:hypothetical protein